MVATVVCGLAVAGRPSAALADRVPCRDVLAKFDQETHRQGGRRVSVHSIGKALGVDDSWVERCLAAYGRQTSGRFGESDRDRLERDTEVERGEDDRLLRAQEKWESEEAGEREPEAKGAVPPEPTPRPLLRVPSKPTYNPFMTEEGNERR